MNLKLDKAHLILLAVVLAVAGLGVYLFLDRAAQHAHDLAVISQHDLDSAKQQATAYAQIAQAKEEVIQEQRTEAEANAKLLAAAIASRNVTLVKQQKTDSTLPPSELSKRWASLVKEDTNAVTQAAGTFTVTSETALRTVQTLEEVPVLTQNVDDLDKTVADRDTVIAGLDTTIELQKKIIANDAAVLKAQVDADKKELSAVKAASRKSKIKWFLAGFVSGFLTRTLTVK